VLVDSEELLPLLLADDPGQAGVHRINVDDVGNIKDRVRMVLHAVGLHRNPSLSMRSSVGPVEATCIHAEALPGPPLKEMRVGPGVRLRV